MFRGCPAALPPMPENIKGKHFFEHMHQAVVRVFGTAELFTALSAASAKQ